MVEAPGPAPGVGRVFIGRTGLIRELTAGPPRGDARVVDTFGIVGIGKTSLLERVRRELQARHNVIDLRVHLRSSAPVGLPDTFYTFHELVGRLGEQMKRQGGREARLFASKFDLVLRNTLQVAKVAQVNVYQVINLEGATVRDSDVGNVDVPVGARDPMTVEVQIDEAQALLSREFVKQFNEAANNRPALVTVDDIDGYSGHRMTGWLVQLLSGLRNTLVLIARSPATRQPDLGPESGLHRGLRLFSRGEVGELLLAHMPGVEIDPRVVDRVYRWSRGHPFSCSLAARVVERVPRSSAAVLDLSDLPRTFERDRVDIVRKQEIAPGVTLGDALRATPGFGEVFDAVEACAVARRFDTGLIEALLRDREVPVVPGELVNLLKRAGFSEADGDPMDGFHRLHTFIRQPLAQDLRETDRARFQELHRRAAAHIYYKRILPEEPTADVGALAYKAWYRYEQPDWQANVREWLYHESEASESEGERLRARARFARVFFDAFWWWGCYVHFPFCDDLLADWQEVRRDDTEWVGDFRVILDHYPIGYPPRSGPGLGQVATAIRSILAECGLDGPLDRLRDADSRHTRALADTFLADTYRYRQASSRNESRRNYLRAADLYARAAALFELNEDPWDLAWTLFESADMHAEYQFLPEARRDWQRAVPLALEEHDEELVASLHRLRADMRWLQGDPRAAFQSHGRAILHAYLFQGASKRRRPDPYTLAFYLEQLDRSGRRLQGLAAGDDLRQAATWLHEPFGRAFPIGPQAIARASEKSVADVVAALFPAPPSKAELDESRSRFMERWHEFKDEMGDGSSSDLAGLEP